MKILVTGSEGFIGVHLMRHLVRQGYDALGIDVEPNKAAGDYQYAQCDILDAQALEDVLRGYQPTTVIHLAARTDLLGKTLEDYRANIDGVRNLVEAIRKTRGVERCVFTSSQLVCRPGYLPQHDLDFQPINLYGQSKVLTEKIVRECNGADVVWCLTRPTTIWGAGMSKHYQRFFRMIYTRRYFHVGKAPVYKSYGYVGNTTFQYEKLITAAPHLVNGRVFYLADYEPVALTDWVNAFQQAFGSKPVFTMPTMLAQVAARVGDGINAVGYKAFPFNSFRLHNVLVGYQFDLTGLEEITGPLPYSMEQGVEETVKWLKNEGIIPAN